MIQALWNRIKRESLYFFSAVMYFTRIPCPGWVSNNYDQKVLNHSRKYFPLMGWIVAGLSLIVYYLSFNFLSIELTLLLTILASILITGGFHEDGLADSCDALGGGWTKEDILRIMKDSRIGTFGSLGLILALAIKFTALRDLAIEDTGLFISTYIYAHAGSRFLTSHASQYMDYVQSDDKSKSKPIAESKLGIWEMLFSFVFVAIPMLFLVNQYLVLAFIPGLFVQILLSLYYKKWIGGFTGDCLGSIQQVTEITIYIATLVIWKFIPIYGRIQIIEP